MKDSGYKWLGKIPDDWEVVRLKSQFSFGKGLPITKADLIEEGFAVISYGQIHSKANSGVRIEKPLIRYVSKDFINTNPSSLVNEGDFIFADTSEDMEGCGNCVYVDSQQELFAGYHTIIARSLKKQSNKYLAYQFLTDNWRSQIREKVDGVKLFSTTQTILKQTYVLLPPQDVQKKIADFLDSKCTEIQAAIDNTKQTIEEYKKLKTAVITKAVTKGIRSNRKMKDSGIEWIGQIPEEWGVNKLKPFLRWKSEKGYGKEQVLSLYRDYGVLPKDSRDDNYNVTSLDTDSYKLVDVGDFVINKMKAWQGSMGISKYRGIISPAYHVCTITSDKIWKPYFHYLMRNKSYLPEYERLSGGIRINQWDLQFETFCQIKFLIPSIEEQTEIATYLDKKCSQIDTVIAQKDQFITEMEKYKQSLIYECVTGKRVIK